MSPRSASPRLRNACGQHAAARLLSHRGLGPAGTPRERAARLYATHPPDTPLKLLGTSPRGVERMLEAHGLPAERAHFQAASDARDWLERALAAGPVALLVDLRPLGSRLPMLHWTVATAATPEGVACENLVRTPFDARRAVVPWNALLRAWRCRIAPLPGYRYAAVAAAPRLPH